MKKPRLPNLGQVRLVAFATTFLILLVYYLAPLKEVVLAPHDRLEPVLFADNLAGGKSEAKWLNYENTEWECTKRQFEGVSPFCGAAFNLRIKNKLTTFDFSTYDFMYLYLSGGGTIEKVKVHVRNHNPAYSTLETVESQKPNTIAFRYEELENNRVKISFNEFTVGDWWLEQYDIPRNLIAPEFDNITSFSIEAAGAILFEQPQRLRFDKLVLVGRWVSTYALYFSIFSVWGIILGVDSGKQIYHFYRRSVTASKRVEYLTDYAHTLQKESDKYRELSAVDPLTGIYNRAGFANRVEGVLSGRADGSSIGLIVFDIDHFKKINDSFGHDVGDKILKDLAGAVSKILRDSDTLARWGGEEFVVLSVMRSGKNLIQIGEKIRQIVQAQKLGLGGDISITISVGLTLFSANESFEKAFKRADKALYQAKSDGRNRSVVA